MNIIDFFYEDQMDLAFLEALAEFDNESYKRKHLLVTRTFELILIGWLPGQGSAFHNHAESRCLMMGIAGTLTELSCTRNEWSCLPDAAMEISHLRPGERLERSGSANFHLVRNQASTNAISLHLYSPPLSNFEILSTPNL